MENETLIKNKTQVLGAIERYFKDLYISASGATQELFRNCAFLSFPTKSEMNVKAF